MSALNKILDNYNELNLERRELNSKAVKIGFKPEVPKMPKKTSDLKLLQSTLSGFVKRFGNWKLNLKKFEESRN